MQMRTSLHTCAIPVEHSCAAAPLMLYRISLSLLPFSGKWRVEPTTTTTTASGLLDAYAEHRNIFKRNARSGHCSKMGMMVLRCFNPSACTVVVDVTVVAVVVVVVPYEINTRG